MRQALALLLTATLSGCFPATFSRVPEIRGRVVDASGSPMPNATVHLSKVEGYGGYNLNESVTSDSAGRFRRKERAEWGLYIVPMDPFGSRFEAIAVADGQQSETREIVYPWMKVRFMGLGSPAVNDVGDLVIDRPTTQP
jgi:hypothetical protein